MKITVARSAGLCFGVNRAIEIVEKLLDEGKKVCTLGPIIHNPQKVREFEQRGVTIADTPENADKNSVLVIRAHGIPAYVEEKIKSMNLDYRDATCPFVKKIHNIVLQHSKLCDIILIAGDKNHPEVQGIIGHCSSECFTFSDSDDLERVLEENPFLYEKSACVVAQTTFDMSEWKKSLEKLKKLCTNAKIYDTICNATSERQNEAEILASQSDLMLVIGGKHSSNTNKLYKICEIKKVEEGEENFKELLEESLKTYNTDGRVKGVVVEVTPTEARVDVGRKQTGIVPLAELTTDPSAKVEDIVKVGDVIDLKIMKTNDQEGTILLSKRIIDSQKGWDEIVKAQEDKTVVTGTVTEVVKGGIIAVANGVKVFIPKSLATAKRDADLEELLKQEVSFQIIETTPQRRRAVGSVRAVLNEERKKKADEFWASAEVGKVYQGVVKSLTSYGAFVDIGGIDGMVHISELSWNRIKHPSEVVNVGDEIEVYIKALDQEKGKISLGYKKAEDNPWEILKRDYPVGTVCEVEIVGLTPFGAFASILPHIDGLIHVSQISEERVEKPQDVLSIGQKVKVKITGIDFDKKRISLSMRDANEAAEEAAE